MITITVVNKSTVVSDADVKLMVAASNKLLVPFCTAWNLKPIHCVFAVPTTARKDFLFYIIDTDTSVPDALAYHTEEDTFVLGYVLAKTILVNGGVSLFRNGSTPTVASALFHEIAEAIIDPFVGSWWQSYIDGHLYAQEVCDPVQNNIIPVLVPNAAGKMVTVGLSDFVYPAWSDSQATPLETYNYLKTLKRPFSLAKGGYVVYLNPSTGEINYIFAEAFPEWLKDVKKKSSRLIKRVSNNKLIVAPKPAINWSTESKADASKRAKVISKANVFPVVKHHNK